MPGAEGAGDDEIKVYRVEGEHEDDTGEHLTDLKSSLLTECEDKAAPRPDLQSTAPYPSPWPSGKAFNYLPPPFHYVPYPHPSTALSMVNSVPMVGGSSPFVMVDPLRPPPAHLHLHKHHKPPPGVSGSHFYHPSFSPPPGHIFHGDLVRSFSSWHHSAMYSMAAGFRSSPYPVPTSPLPPRPDPPNEHKRPLESKNESVAAESEECVTKKNKELASHIKKPLNAFMLFMRDMRAAVMQECTLRESAAINQLLGKKWHNLGREEQQKYYELAKKERQLHMQRYPGWTARDNYALNAKKKKHKKEKVADADMNNPKKCRARFGLDQQSSWCKPCRRKKKCMRWREEGGESGESVGSPPSPGNSCTDSGNGDLEDTENDDSVPRLVEDLQLDAQSNHACDVT